MGCILLDGKEITHMGHKETARRLGVVAQHNAYDFDFLVKDIVLIGRSPHKRTIDVYKRQVTDSRKLAQETPQARKTLCVHRARAQAFTLPLSLIHI